MALSTLKPGRSLDSWEEFETFLKELETVNFYPLRFKDKKTIVSYNKVLKGPALDEKWKFKHATVICKHSGKPTSRSKDHTRPNQFQFACECPFHFKIVFNTLDEKFLIPKTGNLNESEAGFVDAAVKMDVLPGKIASELKLKYNKYVTSKDIENRRQLVQEQVELFAKYPEAIQLDGTHRTI
ncbi:hypothetical protein OUZ56_009993 [Daphnia magna]|uniref:SWIM-type domain-containing protein n=1 Tax=Daphnia magna TaxID=35525 RepID=A0ABR0AHH2_9CRUS|nr:hypothetical protein OUZ56_009993 [Daphnia magna]